VFFLLIEFPLHQQKLCVFYFPLRLIFVDTCCTHFIFRSQFQFSPPKCHHCGLSGHVHPQCSLLKAQKAKAKKEVPRQAHYGTRPTAQHRTPSHQAPHQAPRYQYQAPWSHAPQHQWPQQRFVPANHSGTYKSKPKSLEGLRK
jgi:hypothetical protein